MKIFNVVIRDPQPGGGVRLTAARVIANSRDDAITRARFFADVGGNASITADLFAKAWSVRYTRDITAGSTNPAGDVTVQESLFDIRIKAKVKAADKAHAIKVVATNLISVAEDSKSSMFNRVKEMDLQINEVEGD